MTKSKQLDFAMGRLDGGSVRELYTVDYRLASVFLLAIARYHRRFPTRRVRVTEGHRTATEQEKLVADGKSQTQQSLHLDGRAVDLAILKPNPRPTPSEKWVAEWDLAQYRLLDSGFVQPAALELGFEPGDILWGGHWTTLRDGVHWQMMLPPL